MSAITLKIHCRFFFIEGRKDRATIYMVLSITIAKIISKNFVVLSIIFLSSEYFDKFYSKALPFFPLAASI